MDRPAPYSATDRQSFAYESTLKRWPIILTGVVNDLYGAVGASEGESAGDSGRAAEGKALIAAVSSLKYDMAHDRPLAALEDDGGPTVERYNAELARLDTTWFSAPWLFAECYLYVRTLNFYDLRRQRRLRCLFGRSKHWQAYDPFLRQKLETFRSSSNGVHALVKLLDKALADDSDPHLNFLELSQADLWGNATDLSLLTNLSQSDITRLQGGSADKSHQILVNDLEQAWKHISGLKKARIDIVLDNSGFELLADLVFADWLVSTVYCDRVVFHPKLMPWFVSDVTQPDFRQIFESLADLSFFSNDPVASPLPEDCERMRRTLARWHGHLEAGRWQLSVPLDTPLGAETSSPELQRAAFWTEYDSFCDPPQDLLDELAKSGLVIFKGDLNYRKLTGDLRWPPETPFRTALGSLAGKIPILALRTCKADVIVGLAPGKADELDSSDPRWRVSGSYAVVQFCK